MKVPVPKKFKLPIKLAFYLLAIGIVVAIMLISSSMRANHSILKGTSSVLLAPDYRNMKPFTAIENKAMKQWQAGFWEYIDDDTSRPYTELNRLELKDNGIFWQVITRTITLPSGAITLCRQIVQGYLNPHAPVDPGKSRFDLLYEVRILGQVLCTPLDTCYWATNLDTVWRGGRDSMTFILEGRRFHPYTDSIATFFPSGAVKTMKRFNIVSCTTPDPLRSFIIRSIGEDVPTNAPRIAGDVTAIIQRFYRPLLSTTRVANPWRRVAPDSIVASVSFGVDADGLTVHPKVSCNEREFTMFLEKDMAEWRFPRSAGTDSILPISYGFTIDRR